MADPKTWLHRGKYLSLIKEGHWEYAVREKATGAAIIAAVTPDGNLLLVEQYRIPVHARTIELPAGLIGDEPDDNDAEAARRELLEETGYLAETMEAMITGPASSGLASELVTIFVARNLQRKHAGGGVDSERIIVHEAPLKEIDAWLAARAKEGLMIEPKVYTGLYFLRQQK